MSGREARGLRARGARFGRLIKKSTNGIHDFMKRKGLKDFD